MTNKIRFTKITIERHEATTIRRKGSAISTYCSTCQSTVTAHTLEETAMKFHITIDEIGDLARTSAIHFIHTSGSNLLLVCGGGSQQSINLIRSKND